VQPKDLKGKQVILALLRVEIKDVRLAPNSPLLAKASTSVQGALAVVASLLFVCAWTAFAQSDSISPGRNLEVLGVPPIPKSLAKAVQPYSQAYGLPLAGWDPTKREIWLKGISSATWVSRIKEPGAPPAASTIYIQSSGIYDIYFQPKGKYLAFTRDAEGNETFQLYLYDIAGRKAAQLSDGKSRNTEPVWSNAGDKIVYSSTPTGDLGVNLRLIDPADPTSDRLLAKSSGNYFKAYDWSPDDKQIVFCDFTFNTAGALWLVDVESGKKSLLAGSSERPEFLDFAQFSKDGKGVYAVTDHDSDVRRLAYIDLASRKFTYIPSDSHWDVDESQLAPDGRTMAFTTNEEGLSHVHLFDLATQNEKAITTIPRGIISDLKWHANSNDLAFNFRSFRTPNDVYSVNILSGKVDYWATSFNNRLNADDFAKPELVHWTTFDKRTLSGFLYRPPAKFLGKRPVIIDIHGGPEEQFRPGFNDEENYFINELGVAKIYPNVRGSSGYGKVFAHLDDGLHREDAVKDIGTLLDWIKTQPGLDADRVLVQGGSYGGFLALSAACRYGGRIRGTISESGISDLASFIERTEGWRRGLQRAEFGDERIPKIREFMEHTAPLNNTGKIRTPLLIIHGANDPRVPATQAASIVAATKDRVPVWYILAKDEGHGFSLQSNRDYKLYASILFVKEFLLR
jgi:dipeptidyl aminopeptidase/acylaminoacyl peptidase